MKDNKLEKPRPIRKIPNKKITPKPPRPNIMWFYVIIVVVLLGVATMMQTGSTNPITFQRFSEQMLKNHDVDHVTTYKSGDLLEVEVFLKKTSVSKPEYQDAKKADRGFSLTADDSTMPQYVFTADKFADLNKAISDAETSFGYAEADRIPVTIEACFLTGWCNVLLWRCCW